MSTDYRWDNFQGFINNVPPPAEDVAYFSSQPWLAPCFEASSSYRAIPFLSRYDKGSTLDRFFNKVIKTDETIPHCIALVPKKTRDYNAPKQQQDGAEEKWDFILLAALREDICGHPGTAHGGLLSALFDEAMGCCVGALRTKPEEMNMPMFTGYLNTIYKAQVEVPSVIAIRTRLERNEGRKWFLVGELVGSDGKVRTTAECLYIAVKPKPEEKL